MSRAQEFENKARQQLKDSSSFFGLLGSPPNHMQAVEDFQTAANLYRNQKHPYLAAQATLTAGSLLEKANPERSASIYKQASNLFYQGNSSDRAAEVLEKGARALELTNKKRAFEMYMESINLYEQEDHIQTGINTYSACLAFTLRSGMREEALQVSLRMQEAFYKIKRQTSCYRQVLATVLILLSDSKYVDAFNAYTEAQKYGLDQTEESAVILSIFNAVETADQEMMDMTLTQNRYLLENEVLKLNVNVPAQPMQLFKSSNLQALQDEIEDEGIL
ncbi:hypothetical protein HDV01_007741 [Terramyces sp. JEL0728]|nr:hypothetical protein HDV01_007741 [Terramyces sp. JEL0728]